MHLRSVPLVLAVELARHHQGDDLVSRLTERVVQRADEITELLAFYSQANERTAVKRLNKLSKQLQQGLAAAFNKFDEYQFAKYNRAAQITLKDALFLVHPKAKDEAQQALFDKIVQDELATPYTWETELSALGQLRYASQEVKQAAISEKWEELIFSNRLGYMATLRNLRNILEAGVSTEAIDKVCEYLSDAYAVSNSRQLPFRFLSAYRELQYLPNGYVQKLLGALERAVLQSAANIAGYDESVSVVIAADVSGSMQVPVSEKSKVQRFDIGPDAGHAAATPLRQRDHWYVWRQVEGDQCTPQQYPVECGSIPSAGRRSWLQYQRLPGDQRSAGAPADRRQGDDLYGRPVVEQQQH
jgi:60 kDa SS-A/Ro ribonucleoprotein